MRKLVITLLSLSLMAPAAALALGLGEIKLNSALNQRLDAEIELLSVNPGEADAIDVSLASAETFSRIGLERPAVLMRVKFEIEQKDDGNYVIKATSREAIREPFLDFLVQVTWPTGKVLREYTLLLDPPVSHTETAAPIAPATSTVAADTPAEQVEESDTFVPPPSSIPVDPEVAARERTSPKATAPQAGESDDSQSAAGRAELVYGPVKANDTLWAIALKMRPSKDVSPQQMMMALLEANPYAFFDNNINRLKKGYVLRIDDPALLTAMSKAEAARQVSSQTRAWEDYRASKAAKAAERQSAADEQPAAASASAPASEPKLKLVAPEEGAGESAGGAENGAAVDGATSEELMLALESSAAQRKENEALQSRVQDLEAQLEDMQRLIQLKDADLAALQQQLRQQGEGTQADATPETSAVEQQAAGQQPEEGQTEQAEGGAAPVAEETDNETTGQQSEAGAKPAEQPATESKEPEAKAEPKAEPKPEPKPKPKARPQPAPQPEPGFFESLLKDPLLLAAGGGTLVLLLVLGAVLIRRRRKGGFQESILSGGTSSMLNTKADEGSGETSFLSDLAISGMGGGAIAADEGEVDPLTEADVFMAYGRNQQAEEVLKKALESNPDRPEVIAKLLEVYHSSGDKEKFEALVEQSGDKVKANDELWRKIAPLGLAMLPGHALFADAAASPTPEKPPVDQGEGEPMADDVLDIGLDLDELSAEMEGEASDGNFDLGMDFDLDDDTKADTEGKAAEKTAETDIADMDFELDLDSGTAETPADEPKQESSADEFDFELGTEGEQTESDDLEFDLGGLAEEQGETDSDVADDLNFDLGELDTDTETEEAKKSAPESDSDMDFGDLDFGDLEFGGAEEPSEETQSAAELDIGDLGSEDDFGDLGDLGDLDDDESMLDEGDEITTKLDLAQAYIEMGDNEGARSMLEEVVEGGNDEQKQQAQELLDKI